MTKVVAGLVVSLIWWSLLLVVVTSVAAGYGGWNVKRFAFLEKLGVVNRREQRISIETFDCDFAF